MDLRFGMIQDEAGTGQSDLSARLDVAMAQYHCFQGMCPSRIRIKD